MQPALHEKLRLRDLRLIDAVAREGTLVGAARRLSQSQPAVTKALQGLEALLDVQLFDRTAKGVSPTLSGALLTETAARVLREMDALDLALSDVKRGRCRILNIGAETGTADAILMSALSMASADQPNLEIRIVEGACERLIDDLAEARLDLVVGRLVDRASGEDLFAQPLYDEPIALMARSRHPIFVQDSFDGDVLGRFDTLTPERTGQVAREVEAFVQQSLPTSRCSLKSSSVALVKEMVHITDSMVVGPATFMAGDIERGDVKIVPLPGRAAPRPAGFIHRRDAPLPDEALPFLSALSASAARVAHLLAA